MKKLIKFPTSELKEDNAYVTIAQELNVTDLTSDKDTIRLKNLVNEAKKEVKEVLDKDIAEQLLKQLNDISRFEKELVTHQGGLVIYVTVNDIYYYHLSIPTRELISVGEEPHLKPLIENYQYKNQFHLLVLSGNSIRFFEGDLRRLTEIQLDEDGPRKLEDVVDTDYDGGKITHGNYGAPGVKDAYHGHDEISKEKRDEKRLFYGEVDTYIYENYSKELELPLLILSSTENQKIFRNVSGNQYLIDAGIEKIPGDLSDTEIEKLAIDKDFQLVKKEQEKLIERFRETTPEYRIDNRLDDLASTAKSGRIEEIVFKRGIRTSGSISETGRYIEDDRDFIKQLIYQVIATNGKVYVLPEDEMPVDIDISARLRY